MNANEKYGGFINYLSASLGFVIFLATKSPTAAPIICATINAKIDSGAIPVIEVVKTRPIVIAGFANEVLEVSKIPPNIQRGA